MRTAASDPMTISPTIYTGANLKIVYTQDGERKTVTLRGGTHSSTYFMEVVRLAQEFVTNIKGAVLCGVEVVL